MKKIQILAIVVAAFRLMACGGTDNRWVDIASTDQNLEMLDHSGLLAFVNDQASTTFERLDLECGIRSHAAANIIALRDGPDGVPGTADDDLFDSLEELDDVKQVGPWTMEQLYLCADDTGYLFADEAGFMAFMNDPATTFGVLDVDCAIRSDSAANIIALRDGPDGVFGSGDDDLFGSVAELDSVVMVGLWTIDRLYACADARGYLDGGVVPEPEPDPDPDDYTVVWNLDSLDPALRDLIEGDLLARAEALRDRNVYFPVRFAEVFIYTASGVPVRYEVRYVQTLDPECGVQLWIIFELDTEYNVINSNVYI